MRCMVNVRRCIPWTILTAVLSTIACILLYSKKLQWTESSLLLFQHQRSSGVKYVVNAGFTVKTTATQHGVGTVTTETSSSVIDTLRSDVVLVTKVTNILEPKTHETQQKRDCPLKIYQDVTNIKPRVSLDPNKFLLPWLLWGPNNQLVGFRESVFLAIKLNRTLVIPHFAPQYNDHGRQGLRVVSAFNRINVPALAGFISTISIQEFQEKCNRKLDVIFQNRPRWCFALREAEELTGVDIFGVKSPPGASGRVTFDRNQTGCDIPDIATYPSTVVHNTVHDSKKLDKIFNSSAKCAMFLYPFKSLSLPTMGEPLPIELHNATKVEQMTSSENIHSAKDDVILAAIEHVTTRPVYVEKIAENFIRDIMKVHDFVSVHWRFDKEMVDTMCSLNSKDVICNVTFTPNHLAHAILAIQSHIFSTQRLPVYIAAPPTLSQFIQQVREILENRTANNTMGTAHKLVWDLSDLKQYTNENYSPELCPDIRPTPNDFLSLAEMEICSRSTSFLFSRFSSWSAMVLHSRPKKSFPYDRSAFDLSVSP
nr:uncharacterized protein LOC100180315 [Ciona intestinalis]|eukprot:XP_026696581.1 uncharacterized protein LOC100180315 [Ciona intestinalis]